MDNKEKLKQKLQKKSLKKKLQTKPQSKGSSSEISNNAKPKPQKDKTVQSAQINNNNTSTKSKTSNEIDDIFANVKKKAVSEPKVEVTKKRTHPQSNDDGFFDSRGTSSKRKNADGIKVYTEEELGLSKNITGGGTPLCPFDCDCCF